MTCKSCGYENAEGSVFCANCGASMEAPVAVEPVVETSYAQPAEVVAPKKKADGMTITALILSIVGLVGNTICSCLCGCLGGSPALIMSIVGLILGIIAMNKSKKNGEKNNMALTAVILSGVGILMFIIFALIGGAISSAIMGSAGMDADFFEDLMYEMDLY